MEKNAANSVGKLMLTVDGMFAPYVKTNNHIQR